MAVRGHTQATAAHVQLKGVEYFNLSDLTAPWGKLAGGSRATGWHSA